MKTVRERSFPSEGKEQERKGRCMLEVTSRTLMKRSKKEMNQQNVFTFEGGTSFLIIAVHLEQNRLSLKAQIIGEIVSQL